MRTGVYEKRDLRLSFGMFDKLELLKLTHNIWNEEISKILCHAYSSGVINSNQLHQLTAMFDPTQQHKVGKL